MSVNLRGRTAVVTGAAGGLGRGISEALASAGANLVLVDIDGDAVAEVAAEIRDGSARPVSTVVADIADVAGRQAIVAAGAASDILVNNAALERASEYTALTATEVEHAMAVNLLGALLLTHALLPGMRQRGQGHVVTIASMAGIKAVPYNAVYNTSKAGLVAFSTSLSKELEGSGVFATVVCPSAVRDAGMWARVSDMLPRNRLVESSTIAPADVAAAVLCALQHRPTRILVASPLVRAGALLSALSPAVDRLTDRLSRIGSVYRQRIETDRDNPL